MPSPIIDLTQEPGEPRRAVLCAVQLTDVTDLEFRESLDELRRLAKTLGLTVDGEVVQRRSAFDPGAYLGPGKLTELAERVAADPQPTLVLCDHEISPSQARNLEKAAHAAGVMDRTAVILEIFRRHARSRQAKMQVEIVRLQYLTPRLRETKKGGGDRQRGGIGGKGAGESALELDRRKIRDRISQLKEELAALQVERDTQRSRRQGLRRAALCGYTNAGKSTLFRALTASEVYIADKLFATLETTVRTLQPEARPKILLSDTIGFIRNLPTKLIASFKSTLDEALEASLIVHVVDAADPACERHMATTSQVLSEIGAGDIPQILVFNKIDKLPGEELSAELRDKYPDAVSISAKDPADVARLRQVLIDTFDRELVQAELVLPYDRQGLRGQIFADSQVLEEKFTEDGVHFTVRTDAATLARLRGELGGRTP